jgi:hypothetical protein
MRRMAEPRAFDPTLRSLWRPLRLLQASMDADIARVHAGSQIDGLKPSYIIIIGMLRR